MESRRASERASERESEGIMGARLKNEPMAATLDGRFPSPLPFALFPSLLPLRFLQFNKLPL